MATNSFGPERRSNSARPSANGMTLSRSPWTTQTGIGAATRLAKSAVGKRYVEKSARKASGGDDDRTSARASGKPDSRINPSGAATVAAYAAIVVPSDRPQ